MTKPEAINCKKLVASVLPIIAKGVDSMLNEKLEKLKLRNTFKYEQSQTYIVESKECDNDNLVFTVG